MTGQQLWGIIGIFVLLCLAVKQCNQENRYYNNHYMNNLQLIHNTQPIRNLEVNKV